MHHQDVFDVLWPVMIIAVPVALFVHRSLHAKVISALLVGGMTVAVARAFHVIGSTSELLPLAELGVMLLLLCHGLDLNVSKLRQGWRSVVIVSALQLSITIILGALAAPIVVPDCTLGKAIMVGLIMATSSPATMWFELRDRNAEHSPEGELAGQLSIAHDLFLPVVALVVPFLAPSSLSHHGAFAPIFVGIAVVLTVLIVEWVLSARVLDWAGRNLDPVLFLMFILTLVLGMVVASRQAHLSPAFGCFLAGMVIARTHYRNLIRGWGSLPRDLSLGLFFIIVGTLFDWDIFVSHWPRILISVIGMVALKVLGTAVAGLVVGLTFRGAIRLAGYLATIGEASFVIGIIGLEFEVIDKIDAQVMVALSVISLGFNPTVNKAAHYLQRYVPDLRLRWSDARLLPWIAPRPIIEAGEEVVVVVGCERVGREILRDLMKLRKTIVVIERNSVQWRLTQEFFDQFIAQAKKDKVEITFRHHVLLNDAASERVWKTINGHTAQLIVVTNGNRELVVAIDSLVKRQNGSGHGGSTVKGPTIVVRTRDLETKQEILEAVEDCIVCSDDEGGIHPLLRVLETEVANHKATLSVTTREEASDSHDTGPPVGPNGSPQHDRKPLAGVLPAQQE